MEIRRHHIFLLIAVLIFGSLIEFSKISGKKLQTDRRLRIALNNEDEQQPYTRPDNESENIPEGQRRFAPTNTIERARFPENNTFSHPPPPPAGERGVVTAKKADDKNKKDKDKEKEKKKKKKEAHGIPAPTPLQVAKELPPLPKKQEPPVVATAPPAAPDKDKPDYGGFGPDFHRGNSQQEWERKLLNQPDSAATNSFVKAFKSGSVSQDVFYSVVGKMIGDPRENMKLLGVAAAGQVQSYQSFNLLVTAITKNAQSSQTAQAAQTQLNKYAKMEYESVLETVLRTAGPAQADVYATTLIGTIATQLSSTIHGTSGGGTGGGSTGSGTAAYSLTFKRLAELIKKISSVPGANGQLASAASSTLSAIDALLGS